MNARYVIAFLVGSASLVLGFQNCAPGKSFQAISSNQSSVGQSLTTPLAEPSDAVPEIVVSCMSPYPDTGKPGVCLEYNGYTPEMYGVNNCTSTQLVKSTTKCPRNSDLVGRCKSTVSAAGDIFTYKYAPDYADQALREIVTEEAKESCRYAGTWEDLD